MQEKNKIAISVLIFPIAPVVVMYLIFPLCWPILIEYRYWPNRDGGEAMEATLLLFIPPLLLLAALALAGLTFLTRWVSARFQYGIWWRVLMSLPRIGLVACSMDLFFSAVVFFMGDPLGVARHWQVAVAWIICAVTVGAFLVQQYRRL